MGALQGALTGHAHTVPKLAGSSKEMVWEPGGRMGSQGWGLREVDASLAFSFKNHNFAFFYCS